MVALLARCHRIIVTTSVVVVVVWFRAKKIQNSDSLFMLLPTSFWVHLTCSQDCKRWMKWIDPCCVHIVNGDYDMRKVWKMSNSVFLHAISHWLRNLDSKDEHGGETQERRSIPSWQKSSKGSQKNTFLLTHLIDKVLHTLFNKLKNWNQIT